jgi:hypothetical protein
MVSLCLASIYLLFCPALRVFVNLTWLVVWLSCPSRRIWCKIITIIITDPEMVAETISNRVLPRAFWVCAQGAVLYQYSAPSVSVMVHLFWLAEL